MNTDYTGDCVTVRRASDNNTTNIGFVDGVIDVDALESFCSGTDGFVTDWYSQNGNDYKARNTTASQQPKIVSNGTAIKYNSKVALDYYSTSCQLFLSDELNNVISIDYNTGFVVSKITALSTANYIVFNDSPAVGVGFGGTVSGADGAFIFDGSFKSISGEDLNQHLGYFNDTGTNHEIAVDGGTVTSFSRAFQLKANKIGRNNAFTYTDSLVSEVVLYSSNQSSNKAGIENNINTYYSIY